MAKPKRRKVIGEKKKKRTDWGFGRGHVLSKDKIYICSYMEELEDEGENVTQVLKWTGSWGHWFVEWATGALCVLDEPELTVLTMGLGGRIHLAASSGFSEEEVDNTEEGPAYRGMLRDMRLIGSSVYVCGMGRQVYKRQDQDSWVRADQGVLSPKGMTKGRGFNSIDGFNEQTIYAAGWGGEIWHFDGNSWMQIDSPTNLVLERLICVPPDNVFICGQTGLLLHGKRDNWVAIDTEIEDDFWGMEWYEGKLWLATLDSLYSFDGHTVSVEHMGLGDKLTCGWLHANDSVIWSMGSEDLAYFDGKDWFEVILGG